MNRSSIRFNHIVEEFPISLIKAELRMLLLQVKVDRLIPNLKLSSRAHQSCRNNLRGHRIVLKGECRLSHGSATLPANTRYRGCT